MGVNCYCCSRCEKEPSENELQKPETSLMGDNCYCCRPCEKEPSENEVKKLEKNTNTDNKTHDISQNQNNLIVVNSTQNSQILRSSSPEYNQKIMYQYNQNTQSMSPQSNRNDQSFKSQDSPQVNQSAGSIIPIDKPNNIVYERQNNVNFQTQSIVSQNENIITNNQSSGVFPQQIINTTQGVLDSNQNQINPQVDSQVITVNHNIPNQNSNEPFTLGSNKNGIDNNFDFGFPGNVDTSNSQYIQQINYTNQNQQSDTSINTAELLKQQIGQQQSSIGGNGLNIDELLNQQNNQQKSGAVGTGINNNDLFNSLNNQQTGMGPNMDELSKQQNNQINDLNKIFKSMQLPSLGPFLKNINQKDPLLYSLNYPKTVNISTSYQPNQYSPINSPIKNAISEPLSPSNHYNNIK